MVFMSKMGEQGSHRVDILFDPTIFPFPSLLSKENDSTYPLGCSWIEGAR